MPPTISIACLHAFLGLRYDFFVGLAFPSPLSGFCSADSRLSNRLDISSIFAKISLETPANLFESEFSSSSTTAESSAEEEASVVVEFAETRALFGELDAMAREVLDKSELGGGGS